MYSNKKKQIFLLHFAGGSCYSFDFLRHGIQNNFECHALELPGRGKRNHEDHLFNKRDAILDYVSQIKRLRNDQPYIIYGHSMGATLGLSVVKKLEEDSDAPNVLIVSGNSGPGSNHKDIQRHTLSDPEFKEVLRSLGGVPEEVLENEDLYDFFSPIMRADFEILEKNRDSEIGLVINTPIFAIMGDEEETVGEIENWERFTSSEFDCQIVPGNHFFIHNQVKTLTQIINKYGTYSLLNVIV